MHCLYYANSCNKLLLLIATVLLSQSLKAQTPQFAIVRSDGTTYICTSIDSAYDKAINGDYIYLPGGSFTLSNPINKKIQFFGAGCHPDSSVVTAKTVLNGITLNSGASEGSITGCYINAYCYNGCPPTIVVSGQVNSYSITNCYLNSGIRFDSACTFFKITNNIIGAYGGGCLYGGSYSIQLLGQNHLISNNIILATVSSSGGNIYRNNIFSYCQQWCSTSLSCSNELFENNIFKCASTGVSNSIFKNNIGRNDGTDGQNNQGYNNYPSAIWDSLFVGYTDGWSFSNNIHLKPNSQFQTAGTDGTELGIYGGAFPTNEGWIPSNPHIYYKKIATETNSNGQLQIQYKVRTNN